MATRRNIYNFSPSGIAQYVDAVERVKDSGAYDQFIQTHAAVRTQVHNTPAFLPWHRAMLADFEALLQEALNDSTYGLPYWDWTRDVMFVNNVQNPAPETAPIWGPGVMGGSGSPVTTGPFTQTQWATISPDGAFSPNGGLFRNLSWAGVVWPTRFVVHSLFLNNGYDQFRVAIESGPHNNIHNWIGGQMGSVPNSVNDPVFWLHHCNLDRIWAQWQQIYPNVPIVGVGGFGPDTDMPATNGTEGARKVRDVLALTPARYDYDEFYSVNDIAVEVTTGDSVFAGTDDTVRGTVYLGLPGGSPIGYWGAKFDSSHSNHSDPFEQGETDVFNFSNLEFLDMSGKPIPPALRTPALFRSFLISKSPETWTGDWELDRFTLIVDGVKFESGEIDRTLDSGDNTYSVTVNLPDMQEYQD